MCLMPAPYKRPDTEALRLLADTFSSQASHYYVVLQKVHDADKAASEARQQLAVAESLVREANSRYQEELEREFKLQADIEACDACLNDTAWLAASNAQKAAC